MIQLLKKEWKEFCLLLQSLPSIATSIFILSIFAMNLLANKSISLPIPNLALDCGILLSWVTFLTMDIVTKHFGPKASIELSIFGIFVQLFLSFIFFLVSLIPGVWSASFVEGSEEIINASLDSTIRGTWYIVLGSTLAFLVSSFVNNFINWGIGKTLKKDSLITFLLRTYISTAIGQFVDNFLFAFLVSHFFFGWTMIQCVTCALTGMLVELIFEAIFSLFGYQICQRWKEKEIGKEYLNYKKEGKTL